MSSGSSPEEKTTIHVLAAPLSFTGTCGCRITFVRFAVSARESGSGGPANAGNAAHLTITFGLDHSVVADQTGWMRCTVEIKVPKALCSGWSSQRDACSPSALTGQFEVIV